MRTNVTSDEIKTRDLGICARCGEAGSHAHHRKLRSQGGRDTFSNMIYLCAPCHETVHRERVEARDAGWIVHPQMNPAHVPIARYWLYRTAVLLADDGTLELTEAA